MNNYIEQQFKDAIRDAGLIPPQVIEADGTIKRFSSNGKRGDNSGSYVLHTDGVIPAGWIGDFRTGISQNFRADVGRNLTPTEEAAHLAKVETMKRERKAEEEKRHADAREEACLIWAEATHCSSHPYLTRKGIEPNGTRLYKNSLVIPVRIGGVIHSLQRISEDGSKRFLAGGRKTGCYYSIGKMEDAGALCIGEGFATSATIHQASGYPTVAAFDAGNLLSVAKTMRERFPNWVLFICADDDHKTKGNPGITKAQEAANAVNGVLVIPDFGGSRC